MKITILTLFPEMFQGPFDFSMVKKAQEKKLVEINIVNIRKFGIGKHQVVDDTPYGGGFGMVLRVDVVHNALKSVTDVSLPKGTERVILLSAHGRTFKQAVAKELSALNHLILICGHYEGVDERIKDYIDEEIALGDFIVTGGEIPAMLITDSITRLIKGVLKDGVTDTESYSLMSGEDRASPQLLLEHPQYTKPQIYEGKEVPQVLLSGNHKEIAVWKTRLAKQQTLHYRPDLSKSLKETGDV